MPNLETIVGIVAGVFTGASLIPQLVKMVQEKKATDISMLMLATLMTGLCLWVWYGILKQDWPVIVTNGFSLVMNILILLLRRHYKKAGNNA